MERGRMLTEIETSDKEKEFLSNLKYELDKFNTLLLNEKIERKTRENVDKVIEVISNILNNKLVEVDE